MYAGSVGVLTDKRTLNWSHFELMYAGSVGVLTDKRTLNWSHFELMYAGSVGVLTDKKGWKWCFENGIIYRLYDLIWNTNVGDDLIL